MKIDGNIPRCGPFTVEAAVMELVRGRPPGQVSSMAGQLEDLWGLVEGDSGGFQVERPVAVAISGGRLRIAFMHPDMRRFFGPAWQTPLGAGEASGREQVVMLAQAAEDGRIHLHPLEERFQERSTWVPGDIDAFYPGEDVDGAHRYEAFGRNLSRVLLNWLGYLEDEEAEPPREAGAAPVRRIGASMRRPFPLVANALASLRTVREGEESRRVQAALGRAGFTGLRLASTGGIPEGGFASSSAMTLATLNGIDALHGLGLRSETLVHLACQSEYGTGVRAGSLDQATEQLGKAGEGVVISSNPRDGFRVLQKHRFPAERIRILFPYSVPRDTEAWRWSWGVYSETAGNGPLTTGEMRMMTGKAAEIAAWWIELPNDEDFFPLIQGDLVASGTIGRANREWMVSVLRRLPLCIDRAELRRELESRLEWQARQLGVSEGLSFAAARSRAEELLEGLLAGWRDPELVHQYVEGRPVRRRGLPLRALLAYLFGEVAKCFRLIHCQEEWIEGVTRSQQGDRSVTIAPDRLPPREDLEGRLDWEVGLSGPDLLNAWLDRCGALPFDFNAGLDDATLGAGEPPEFHLLDGGSFFRGLALIDLAEAMLKRAFGAEGVAVRVNAAGQGDYFQVHVDTSRADPEAVKQFIRRAVYRRFGFDPKPEFVEVHPGGGATGVRLDRLGDLPRLARELRQASGGGRCLPED